MNSLMPKARTITKYVAPLLIVCLLGFATWAIQQYPDWVPDGGHALLNTTLENCADCDDLPTLMQADRTQKEWQEYFVNRESTKEDLSEEEKEKGAFAGLEEAQIKTLIDYLSVNFPRPEDEIPEESPESLSEVLPSDGQQIFANTCSGCHSIAVPLNADFSFEGWSNVMSRHTERIGFSDREQQTMVHYLANNMPVPDDELPEDLSETPPGY